MEADETKSHSMVRPEVSTLVTNIHWSRTLWPNVTLTFFCGVVTEISSTHPTKQKKTGLIPNQTLLKALCNSNLCTKVLPEMQNVTRVRRKNTYYAHKHQQAQRGAHLHRKLEYTHRSYLELNFLHSPPLTLANSTRGEDKKTLPCHRQGYSMLGNGLADTVHVDNTMFAYPCLPDWVCTLLF